MYKINIIELIDKLNLVPISEEYKIYEFKSKIDEYTEFLINNALNYEKMNISKTHILINLENKDVIAYVTLLTGSIKLSQNEKEYHSMPGFESYPSLKIAKLAVNDKYTNDYKGIGSLMIELCIGFKAKINEQGVACRFLEVDADIENNKTVVEFYKKCGFVDNEKYSSKKRKTISMRLDDTI